TYDSWENVAFPPTGPMAHAGLTFSRTDLGSDLNYQQGDLSWLSAWSFGRNTISAAVRGASGFNGDLPFYDLYPLGGLFNLSGYRINQLQGQSVALGRVMYYYRAASISFIGNVYAGGSLEAGNVYGAFPEATSTGLKYAGSVFLGADTIIGPAYLAYGYAGSNNSAFYFYLGYPYR